MEKTHTEEPNDLYTSPKIFWVIKSRRMRLAGHVAHVRERRGVYRVLVRKPEGKIFVFPCIIVYGFTRTSLMQIV